jgi:hypothetical protein
MLAKRLLILVCLPAILTAQEDKNQQALMEKVLARLDALEQQNEQLLTEVRELRKEVAGKTPPENAGQPEGTQPGQESNQTLAERVDVVEHRVAEQAQTKVEAAQKLPVQLTGMLLFNAFWNGKSAPGYSYGPDYLLDGPANAGATIRQTLLGFNYDGPTVLHGGKVSGELSLDFSGASSAAYGELRIRRGVIALDWQDRAFTVGQDRLLVAPRSPTSLAEVSVPALSGAGNLWIWVPQARYEERRQLGSSTGIRVQASIVQTAEQYAVTGPYDEVSPVRPGGEARVEIWHSWGEGNRVELASGVHKSTTHVSGASVPSFLYSFDGLLRPTHWLEFTGTYFAGENLAPLSGPALSFIRYGNDADPLRAQGGWLQSAFALTPRLSLNLFGGWQAALARSELSGLQNSTVGYAGNFIYRLGPNVLVSAEAGQYRYAFLDGQPLLRNHYDLALAYTF